MRVCVGMGLYKCVLERTGGMENVKKRKTRRLKKYVL